MTAVWEFLAGVVLTLHVAFAMFVLQGFFVIVAGLMFRRRWARDPVLRLTHAAAVVFIAARVWLAIPCPLTAVEMSLRQRAGDAPAQDGYTALCHRLVFRGADAGRFRVNVLVLMVAVVGALVLAPPRRAPLS